jgi:Tol biopolymer transport system component
LYPADGPANIYALNPSTGESVQLTNFPGGILCYDVDSSGSMLNFSRTTGQNGSSIYRLAINDETQSEPQELISCPHATCRAPSISPLDDYLAYELTAFVGEDNPAYPQVWLLPLPPEIEIGFAGLEPFKAGEPLHQTLQPHWSSNGLLAFYDTSQNAFVILDPVDGETVLFPNQTGQPGSWHPSGDSYTAAEIFFIEIEASDETAGLDQIGSSHLMLFDLSDQSIEDLTQMDNLEDTSPAFSPDGNWLAFARKYLDIQKWTPGRQLWLMDIENRTSAQLTNNPIYNHFEFSWDSTGSQLAFVRFNQTQPVEPPEIWVIDPNTTLTRPIVEGGYAPQWIP